MESVPYFRDGIRSDLRSELPIEAALKLLGVERRINREADDLAGGVHSGIGASGDDRLHLSGDAKQGPLQVSLDGSLTVLTGIAVETRAVVREVDPVGRHC